MKNTIYLLASVILLLSCKKESNIPSSTVTKATITCADNPNINFSSIGTPIGKFADCIKDIDGNTYKTVTIGTQTWMAENMRTSRFNDGSVIYQIKNEEDWDPIWNTDTAAWVYYNHNETYNMKYGKLYNWYSINPLTNDNKNICPSGWHVPSDSEWNILIEKLGGISIAGGKMKELGIESWNSIDEETTNTSLFTGLAGGAAEGDMSDFGYSGYWWSSTEDDESGGWSRELNYNKNDIKRRSIEKRACLSIRCVKD